MPRIKNYDETPVAEDRDYHKQPLIYDTNLSRNEKRKRLKKIANRKKGFDQNSVVLTPLYWARARAM